MQHKYYRVFKFKEQPFAGMQAAVLLLRKDGNVVKYKISIHLKAT
jgi:hypothetical protein